jgi:two-component system, NtrC family, response regulator
MKEHILVVDDDPSFRRVVDFTLKEEGYEPTLAANGREAREMFARGDFSAVITDVLMPEVSGLELLRELRAVAPEVPVLVVTAHAAVDDAVAAMREGAFDYIVKPIHREQLKLVLKRALEVKELVRENRRLRQVVSERLGFENMIGSAPAMAPVLRIAAQAAQVDSTVLLLGESGTGKELLAKAIHFNGPRRRAQFVPVNCAAIPVGLLESELFGHRRGAFTGAVSDQRGRVEAAAGGTLFLDEVGDLEPATQVKLLRLLQEKEIEKVGEGRPIKVDTRIIAATHRDLRALVRSGAFREDLYYRFSVIPIELPPLRRRVSDVPLLASFFLDKYARKFGKELTLDRAVQGTLERYPWPGNIRELENLMERLAALHPGGSISEEDLPDAIRNGAVPVGDIVLQIPPEGIELERVERELIREALERNGWNQTRAAKFLGVTRNTLMYRMQKFRLQRPVKEK